MAEQKNEVALFEQKSANAIMQLHQFKKMRDELDEKEKQFRIELEKAMDEYGIKSFSNDLITISRVEASTSETIDLKAFKEKEPKLYDELLGDYKKVTNKKAYVRIVVK
jgi:hypothetical protein